MNSLTTNAARGMSAQITVRFSVTEPETVAGLLGRPVQVSITHYGGDNPITCITYFDKKYNNVRFYDRDDLPTYAVDLPTYAVDHLADAKRIAAEWSQS